LRLLRGLLLARQKSYPIGQEMPASSLLVSSNLARFAGLHWRWERMRAN